MRILEDFDRWKAFLSNKVKLAEKVGISDDMIARGVDYIQNFLANNIEPDNPEEKLLQKLWLLADQEEKKALSHLVLKLVKEEGTTSYHDKENQTHH